MLSNYFLYWIIRANKALAEIASTAGFDASSLEYSVTNSLYAADLSLTGSLNSS